MVGHPAGDAVLGPHGEVDSRDRAGHDLGDDSRVDRRELDRQLLRVQLDGVDAVAEVADEELFCVEGKTKALDDMIDEVAEVEE